MSVGLRLELRQSQQLVMTPQLQQAIKLLQMSNFELSEFVETELEKNPLLKVEKSEKQDDGEATAEAPLETGNGDPVAADRMGDDHALTGETFDTGGENLHDSSPSDGPNPLLNMGSRGAGGLSPSGDPLPGLEERLADRPSLREHLRAQLGQTRGSNAVVQMARYLVEELDEHGYLRTALEEIAERLDSDLETVEEALALLQTCDPTGVGALDLADCLRLQLAERELLDGPMRALLDNLELVASGDMRHLRLACGVPESDIQKMLGTLRQLDPRPCAWFDTVEPETLIPDIFLKQTDWGGFEVELNSETLPRVLIDRTYIAEVGRKDCVDTKQFLMECHSNANWLIKSLDQRARTIIKVGSEIVRHQEEFFRKGISGLRPLTLREVAEATGMHESTASRVTANKYMSTNRGIFELKFFFTNAVSGGDGDVAAEAVRHRIKAMVGMESPNAILSDDAIVTALLEEGIDIARRTVAKYRKSLDIPSSVARRRQKSIGLHR